MRIGIDACCWSNRRGFGRYTRELLRAAAAQNSAHELTFVVDQRTAAEGEFPENIVLQVVETTEQPTEAASASGSRRLGDLWRMSAAVRKSQFDLFFFPAVYSYFPAPRRVPTLVTLHDVIAETHPRLVFNSRRAKLFWDLKVRHALSRADKVLTVSEDARRRIARTFSLSADEIAVIPEGPATVFRPLALEERIDLHEVRERCGIPRDRPIVLYVGGISPHKNLDRLLQAMGKLRQRQCDWQLVLVGDIERDGFLGCYDALRERVRQENLSDHVTFTGFVPNADLVRLYQSAALLVFPSLDEGFGLPAVEAMACGLPVACSRGGSLPEVVGSAGVLFDPLSVEEMSDAIGRLLSDAELRRRLSRAGLERVQRYSWESAARRLLSLFEEMLCVA